MSNKECRHDTLEILADGGVVRCQNCNKTWLQTTTPHSDKRILHSSRYKCGGG